MNIVGFFQPVSSCEKKVELKLIEKIVEFLNNHVHPHANMVPDEATQGSKTTKTSINQLLADVNNTVLNQNIRIN